MVILFLTQYTIRTGVGEARRRYAICYVRSSEQETGLNFIEWQAYLWAARF